MRYGAARRGARCVFFAFSKAPPDTAAMRYMIYGVFV